jgi:ribosomal protein L11 methyltransferase
MISPGLWQIAVQAPPEYEPAVAAALSHLFQLPASSYTAVAPPLATISVYCPNRPGTKTAVAARLHAALAELHKPGQMPICCRVNVRRLPNRDWTTFWKRHFKPIAIGRKLLVIPPWIQPHSAHGQNIVVLNPGLSFGTGHHPTTAFCLRQVARLHRRNRPRSLLDLGSGSGILAIAAAKLGYRPIEAIDTDPVAVRVASTNARRNRVSHRILIRQQDIRQLPQRPGARFDVVCANLSADLLLAHGLRIVRQLEPAGALVLAGILNAEFSAVESRFTDLGLHLVKQQRGGEWQSGMFFMPG